MAYYTWPDCLAFLLFLGVVMYIIFAVTLVPTRHFLIDHILSETVTVQKASHMAPKWHVMNDSVAEMCTVGRDTMQHRQTLKDSAFWGFKYCSSTGCAWLCCRKAITSPGWWLCCMCRRGSSIGDANVKKQSPC